MSKEQELRVKLKAVEEEIEKAREYLKTLEGVQSDLSRELNTEVHKVAVGTIITLDADNGKLKANTDLLVTKVDDTFYRSSKPWVHVKYKTKSGEWSRDEVCVYRYWRLKDE